MCEKFDLLKEVYMLIEDSIRDNPPFIVREGKIIKDGYSEEVDGLRNDLKGGSGIVTEIEEREKKRIGVPKLKVKYNKIFGYYIEITNLLTYKTQLSLPRKLEVVIMRIKTVVTPLFLPTNQRTVVLYNTQIYNQ